MSSPVPATSPTPPFTNSTSPPPPDTTNSPVFIFPPPPTNTSVNTNLVPSPPAAEAPRSSSSPARPSTPLLAALIAGIVLGVLAGVGISVCVYRRKKRKDAQRLLLAGQPSQGTSKDDGLLPNRQQNAAPHLDNKGVWPKPGHPPDNKALTPMLGIFVEPPSTSSSLGSEKAYPSQNPGISLGFSQSTFTYEELATATDNFSNSNLLGQGGFGFVHKGILGNGTVVAIKQLKSGSGQGEREFQAEIEIITRVHHRHLVSLVGYCITGVQRMLVYEFVPNKTLEFHLHGEGRPTMNWPTRMKIAIGAAKGLTYLHEDCQPKIIHRDIKAANILIDDSFEAKVADFGLAKYSKDTDTHVSTRVMGTFGYLAPEYASSGKLSEKSDVFSFGVVLLELISGRRPVDRTQTFIDDSIVDWARPLLKQALEDGNFDAVVDPKLEDFDSIQMVRMISCAAASVRHLARFRPRMSQIVRALEGNMSLDELNEGVTPGLSTVYSSSGSDYSTRQYEEEMRKFRKLALGSLDGGTVIRPISSGSQEQSGPTSESGQRSFSSNTEGQQTAPEMDSQIMERNIKDTQESS